MNPLQEKLIPLYIELIKNNRKSIDDITDEEVKQQVKIKLEEGNQNV